MQKNIKKYFSLIFILLFFIVFSFFEWEEYFKFYKQHQSLEQSKTTQAQEVKDFSLENIRDLDKLDLYYTPYKSLLDDIKNKIDEAKDRVYIEVYMLTETRIKEALARAKKRWIDVKIVLEKNPYKAYNINNKAYNFLIEKEIDVAWSNPKNFSLNHAKLLIIDDEIIISTWNLTYSTFAYNRDFFIIIEDREILEKLLLIFDADFNWKPISIYDENLVLSPDYSRAKLEKMILEAKSSINMYFQYLKDERLFNLLVSRVESWIKLSILLPESALEDNKKEIEQLISKQAEVVLLKKPTIHSKAILIDEKYLFIWSVNFSEYSLDKNREIWIILKDIEIIKKFKDTFLKDIWK